MPQLIFMTNKYSQFKAMMALAKFSLKAIFRSPSAVIFSFIFPLIFILVFGFIGGSGPVVKIGFTKSADTSKHNLIYQGLVNRKSIRVVTATEKELQDQLLKGRITAIIDIQNHPNDTFTKYKVIVQSSTASFDKIGILQAVINDVVLGVNKLKLPNLSTYASVQNLPPVEGRIYRTIDFILPGQLGFSLLSAGVFGVAFIFFNLRQTLVLKRFFATPISKPALVLGIGISRILFGLITSVVILSIGWVAFNFTMINGWITFFELLVLSLIGLIVFMGFGFIVSGLAKNESVIPPFVNLITLPQFLLGGTFFTTDNFPPWLKSIADILPLTHLNDAMRNVAFEGDHLTACYKQIAILGVWGIVVYVIAIKVFRWE